MTDEPTPTPANPQAQDTVPEAARPPRRRIGEIDGVRVELELHDQPDEL